MIFFASHENNTGPKDVFLHLLETFALYICVGSFIALLFGLIHIHFPDVLEPHNLKSVRDSLRWPLAMLIVVYPFYLWLTTFIQKDVADNPAKQDLQTRRWLLYLTPVLAIIIIAGDLITLIFYFLSGGLTTPFILKVLAVLLIAAVVLTYYGWILRYEQPPQDDEHMKWFTRSIVGLCLVAIVAGLFAVGSPFKERKRRLDNQRINDIQQLEFMITNNYQDTGELPQNLSSLAAAYRNIEIPTDPVSNERYTYKKIDPTMFKLCATFQTANQEDEARTDLQPTGPKQPAPISWNHPAGEHCFDFTVANK